MKEQLDEIRQDVKELVKQGAIHNTLLQTHEARSLALQSNIEKIETRLTPVEQHVSLVSKMLKIIGAVSVGAIVQAIVRLLT